MEYLIPHGTLTLLRSGRLGRGYASQKELSRKSVDTGLPDATRFVVLLCMERGMAGIAEEVAELFAEIALDPFRCLPE